MTVNDYIQTAETLQPKELRYGVLHEAATPSFFHQLIVGRIYRHLAEHVRTTRAGVVVVSPMDVVLDRERALVVQPDVIFVAAARAAICTDRVWGAPDLTVEVLSRGSMYHDRRRKLAWYRKYGVREYWLVDPLRWAVEVNELQAIGCPRLFADGVLRSGVLPALALPVADVFEDA